MQKWKNERKITIDNNWEVPKSGNYSKEYFKIDLDLSIMQPFYEKTNASSVEKSFANFLNDQKDEIRWWFKNGERDGTFFAVPYEKNNEILPFYVDWIVKYKDGKIGLFDTKSGITAEVAKEKAEGLANYIKAENLKGKNLFGGIVILKDGSWRYNDNEKHEYNKNNLACWKFLN